MEPGVGWRVEAGLSSRDVAVIIPEFTLHAVTIRFDSCIYPRFAYIWYSTDIYKSESLILRAVTSVDLPRTYAD